MPVAALTPLAFLVRQAEHRLAQWSHESQLAARRNAMVAATALAQRRAERQEVEDYFASLVAPASPKVAARG